MRRFCLEKPYPAVLEKVFEQEGKILVFADFAGRIAPLLSELNQGRNLTLILDHHVAEASTDPRVINLDPDLFGLKGDRDISGSTTCYLFARTLDPANRDLAHIAAIGAVGDGFFVDGALVSENRDVALEAARQGLVEIRRLETRRAVPAERRRTVSCRSSTSATTSTSWAASATTASGPDMGVKVCLEGVSAESDRMVDELKAVQDTALRRRDRRAQGGRHAPGASHPVVPSRSGASFRWASRWSAPSATPSGSPT